MATVKKTKKSTSKPKTIRKKPVAATAGYRSFKLSRSERPFISFSLTRQTLYWAILLAVIFILALWILKLQLEIVQLTGSVNSL